MIDNEPAEARGAILVSPGSANLYDNNLPSMTVVKDDISELDYNRYEAANKTLDRIIVTNLFTYYGEAYKSLVELWQEAANTFTSSLPIMGLSETIATTSTRLRGAVLNTVSMLCYHRERTLDEACEKYGRDTEQFAAVRKIFDSLYDDHFGYRFLYKLRNIMVHESMEAVSIWAKSYRNNGDPFTDLMLHLDRDTFLKSRKVNATLKTELANKTNEDLDVLRMMMETARPMARANGRLLAILNPDLQSVCDAVVEFDNLFDGKEGTKGLIHQLSPELKPPFFAGFNPWSDHVFRFARYYTTEDWNRSDDED